MPTTCRCADANHRPGCPMGVVDSRRGHLYSGMYDAAPGGPVARVRLLNPGCSEDDSTSRRFALLEIE